MSTEKENTSRLGVDEANSIKITCPLCGESYPFYSDHKCKETVFERLNRLENEIIRLKMMVG